MRRFTPYIALSLAMHLAVLLILRSVRLDWEEPREDAPAIVMTFARIEETPGFALPSPEIPRPAPEEERPPAQIKADVPRPEPSEPPQAIPPFLPQPPVPHARWSSIDEFLGMNNREPDFARQDADEASGYETALVEDRIKKWTHLPAPFGRRKRVPKSLLLPIHILQAAHEGAAFLAAYQAESRLAMATVVGLSLTGGTLRKGLNAVAAGIGQQAWTPEDLHTLDSRQLDILEQVWTKGSVDIRRLYLGLPWGWTCKTLQNELKHLLKRGLLICRGEGKDVVYTAGVHPDQVLRALTANRVTRESQADILRVAQLACNNRDE